MFLQDLKTLLKTLFFFSFSHIFNKISLTILIIFAKIFQYFYICLKNCLKMHKTFKTFYTLL